MNRKNNKIINIYQKEIEELQSIINDGKVTDTITITAIERKIKKNIKELEKEEVLDINKRNGRKDDWNQ